MADLSHILIMLIDILPQTCDLSGFNFLMILVISSPLKEILSITLSVRSLKGGSVLEVLTGEH